MESPHVISPHREIATALLASNNIKYGSTWSDSVQPPVLQHFLNRLIFILQPLLAQEGGLFKFLLQAACPVCFGHWSNWNLEKVAKTHRRVALHSPDIYHYLPCTSYGRRHIAWFSRWCHTFSEYHHTFRLATRQSWKNINMWRERVLMRSILKTCRY